MLNRIANNAAIRFAQSAKYLFLEVVKVLFGLIDYCVFFHCLFKRKRRFV